MTDYFKGVRTLEELKSEYKRLAKKLHPDCGGTDAEMAAVNDQYDRLSAVLPKTNAAGETYQPQTREVPEAFRAAVMAAMNLDGVELELCGCWLWATGNTRFHKEALKEAGYRWSASKSAWYWHEQGYRKHSSKNYSLDEIRMMHGSEHVAAKEREALVAQ